MKAIIARIILVGIAHLLLFELLCQLSVRWRESREERGLLVLVALLVAGLIWAVLPAFRGVRALLARWLCRAALMAVLFIGAWAITTIYYWHVRPNIGLYEEADWVAENPAFQKQLRDRIERNRW